MKKKKDYLNKKIESFCSAFCFISLAIIFFMELRTKLMENADIEEQ